MEAYQVFTLAGLILLFVILPRMTSSKAERDEVWQDIPGLLWAFDKSEPGEWFVALLCWGALLSSAYFVGSIFLGYDIDLSSTYERDHRL